MDTRRKGALAVLLGIIAAAIVFVVGIVETNLFWLVGVPLILLAFIFGYLYDKQQTVEQRHSSNKGPWLGASGAVASVGVLMLLLMLRGTEVAVYVTPVMSVAIGVVVWYLLSRGSGEGTQNSTKVPTSN